MESSTIVTQDLRVGQ